MLGTVISHYKIFEKIGEGGMGVVYKAEDTKLKRTVALKFLPKDLTRNQEARERFQLEAQAAASLNNPNIVTIHEIDEYDGRVYIAMEYVEGDTLRDRMPYTWEQRDTPLEDFDDFKTRKISPGPAAEPEVKPMDINEVLDIAIQVCRGVESNP